MMLATFLKRNIPKAGKNKTMKTLRLVVLCALAVAGLDSSAHADAPVVTTTAATGVSNTVATLNGTVNPDGAATTAWFE